jgi:drug/metabolite transporter (DMT)-like permease
MSPLTPKRTGELAVFGSAILWSFFPVLTILTFAGLTPLFSAAIGTLLAAVFFAALVTARNQWNFVNERRAWKGLILTSLYIGVIFYALIYTGLRYTTAGNEAIMAQMEVFFSFLILGLFLKHERPAPRKVLGAGCMLVGAALILIPKASGWHAGDLLILAATAFAPLGNRAAQEARRYVSAEFIMLIRSALSGAFLLALAFFLEPLPSSGALSSSLWFLLLNGIFLLGLSKILWIEGIHRIPITEAISLSSITPFLTLIVAWLVLGERVMAFQIIGIVPMIAGMWLLTQREAVPSL